MNKCFSEALLYPSPLYISDVKEFHYEEFFSLLSLDSIKRLSEESKQKRINAKGVKKDNKLAKKTFLTIMQSIFNKSLCPLFEMIFNRFKTIKCQLRNANRNANSFFLYNLFHEDEIDVYELSCALCCFLKCDFQAKLHLLFDLTDIDDDGYISKNEIKKMIYTVNYLFAKELSGIGTNSTIIFQSLASIKAKRDCDKLMNHPGCLANDLMSNAYINFDQFYSSIQRLAMYSIEIVPCFVNFRDCLRTKRTEDEIKIRKKHFRDYRHISNDLISAIKSENEYDRMNSEFKARLVFKGIDNRRSKSYFVSKEKGVFRERNRLSIQTRQSIDGCSSNRNAPRKSLLNNRNKENIYEIEYNRINHMESYPGKITIVEPTKTEGVAATIARLPSIFMIDRSVRERKPSYLSLEKIHSEINVVSEKKKVEGQSNQLLLEVNNCIREIAVKAKELCKNPNPDQNLVIRKFILNANKKKISII